MKGDEIMRNNHSEAVAVRMDYRHDRQAVRAAMSYQKRNPLPKERVRPTYITAGYRYRKPAVTNDRSALYGWGFALLGIAFLMYLSHTPSGNALAVRIGETVHDFITWR